MLDFYTGTGASVQGKRDIEAPILRRQITVNHRHQFTPVMAPLTTLEETSITQASLTSKVAETTSKSWLSASSG
jgi:hypothetical protein